LYRLTAVRAGGRSEALLFLVKVRGLITRYPQETDMKFRSTATVFAMPALLAGLVVLPAVHAQSMSASAAASSAKTNNSNKADKPSVDTAASQSSVATKKPAKPGVQSGAKPASAPAKP
jgi:hypothetical protein